MTHRHSLARTRFQRFSMSRLWRVASTVALLACGGLLAACNPVPPQAQLAFSSPYTPEWCQALRAYPNSGGHLYALGQCHERGVAGFDRNENVVVYYFTQAARWGHTEAGAALARMNRPVPYADLQAEASARAERERQNQRIASAIASVGRPAQPRRPLSPLEQAQLDHERLMGRAPPAQPAPAFTPRPVQPAVVVPSFQVRTSQPQAPVRRNETSSVRRNCVNNVCRTERTTCVNGVCSTRIEN